MNKNVVVGTKNKNKLLWRRQLINMYCNKQVPRLEYYIINCIRLHKKYIESLNMSIGRPKSLRWCDFLQTT